MLVLLDTAIGLSFVFLLFSLVITALNELLLSFFDRRAAFLKEGITQLLGNHGPTIESFFRHGLIDSFSRRVDSFPSYVAPDAFAAALLDLVAPTPANADD